MADDIDKIIDSFPSNMSLNGLSDCESSTPQNANTTAGPLPPPTDNSTTNVDDFLKELNRTPLFMTSLDESNGAGGSNEALEALRSLAYEGTKSEVAGNFRLQGNEQAKLKRWADAREFYSKALDVLQGKVDPPEASKEGESEAPNLHLLGSRGAEEGGTVVDLEEEKRLCREIEGACVINRALCNLEMKNYGMATRDAALALKLNSRNVKAYYRSALALLALDKLQQASQAVELGLRCETHHVALLGVRRRVQERAKALQRLESDRRKRIVKQRNEALALHKALKQRGIVLSKSEKADPLDLEDAKIHLEDPLHENSILVLPVLLLYPTVAQSELIKEFRETETIGDHLSYILPCPWDGGGTSNSGGPLEFGGSDGSKVECFMQKTPNGGLVKLGKKVPLRSVLKDGKVQVRNGLCEIFVVPKTKTTDWIEEFKKRTESASSKV